MYLLDTNVVSEIRKIKSGRADPNVAVWAGAVRPEQLYISAVTIHEIETGVLLIERRDPISGTVLRSWFDNDVLRAFERRILPVDAEVARRAAPLQVPDPAPVTDALVAATALAHNMTVVTRNVGDFSRFRQLELLNPWKRTRRL
ncbi:MAG: type II toxin-antitoxin system VapC family toxin [Acidimicrobiia bacterium]|nr:type II toxin-antitoxin system VapC family toxin [Acidimicrobiia bacterium]MYH06397.1 type II toxin-antitoxin system VapC family toxin [Acidimicrobiia bacterium]MYK54871.1 type II toxin-antitoxin system VapC family toxin [Acidimicrobiia bacterium]